MFSIFSKKTVADIIAPMTKALDDLEVIIADQDSLIEQEKIVIAEA
jgi:hypothetical protein